MGSALGQQVVLFGLVSASVLGWVTSFVLGVEAASSRELVAASVGKVELVPPSVVTLIGKFAVVKPGEGVTIPAVALKAV